MTSIREITFCKAGEDHLVKLAMPSEDEVVLTHKQPGCDPHHKVDGKFRIHGNARNYYEAKRERMLSDGWTILSFAGEDMKSGIESKMDEWARRGIVDLSKMEAIDVKEVGKSITISATDLEGPFDDEVQA